MLAGVLQGAYSVSHHFINGPLELVSSFPWHLMSSPVPLPPYMINSHLKHHLKQNRIKYIVPLISNHLHRSGPVWVCPSTKESAHQALPNRERVRASKKYVISCLIPLSTEHTPLSYPPTSHPISCGKSIYNSQPRDERVPRYTLCEPDHSAPLYFFLVLFALMLLRLKKNP